MVLTVCCEKWVGSPCYVDTADQPSGENREVCMQQGISGAWYIYMQAPEKLGVVGKQERECRMKTSNGGFKSV